MHSGGSGRVDFFISRAGPENAFAIWLRALLIAQGKGVILQDTDFKSRNFLDAMHEALKRTDRVIALYSPAYLASDYCMAEAQAALGDGFANQDKRFVPLLLEPCVPDGLLRAIAYKALPDIRRKNDMDLLVREILDWLDVPFVTWKGVPPPPPGTLIARQPICHREVYFQPDFVGRADLLETLARSAGARATVLTNARSAAHAISGLGGVGKKTLARQFAWLYQDQYEGVWWVRAQQRELLLQDLVGLVERFSPAIGALAEQKLEKAAEKALEWIEASPYERPWLIVYDNVERSRDIDHLLPRRNAHVVITSREQEFYGVADVVGVGAP